LLEKNETVYSADTVTVVAGLHASPLFRLFNEPPATLNVMTAVMARIR